MTWSAIFPIYLAKGDMKGLQSLVEVLERKDAQGHLTQLKLMKQILCHWIYCTLVFSSGLFVGVDSTPPLYDAKQLMTEVIGYPTPNQLADLMLGEVDDLSPVLASVLTPINGAIGVLRYPTKPLRIASKILRVSILT